MFSAIEPENKTTSYWIWVRFSRGKNCMGFLVRLIKIILSCCHKLYDLRMLNYVNVPAGQLRYIDAGIRRPNREARHRQWWPDLLADRTNEIPGQRRCSVSRVSCCVNGYILITFPLPLEPTTARILPGCKLDSIRLETIHWTRNLSVPQIQILQNGFIRSRGIGEGDVFEFNKSLDVLGFYRSALRTIRLSVDDINLAYI